MPLSLLLPQSSTSSSMQMVVTANCEDSPCLPWRRLGAVYLGVQVTSEASLALSSNLPNLVYELMSITMAVLVTWVLCALPFPLSFLPFPCPFPFLFPPEPWLPGFCCCSFYWLLLVWLPDTLLPGFPVSFQQFTVVCEEPWQILQWMDGLAFLMVWPFKEEVGAMQLARDVLCHCNSARIMGISLADVNSIVPIVWTVVVTRLV